MEEGNISYFYRESNHDSSAVRWKLTTAKQETSVKAGGQSSEEYLASIIRIEE
jgi:hypothetical protein